MLRRLLALSLVAATVTFGLFWVMQALIGVAGELLEGKPPVVVDFVRLKRESEPETKKREIPDRKPPEQPPPPPQMDFSQNLAADDSVVEAMPVMKEDFEGVASDLGTGGSDRDIVPLVQVKPQYPMRARQLGIEGWVEVMFTVTRAGIVKDVVVTQSYPGSVFDRAAVQAVARWRFNPKIENGVAVERPGVRKRITFKPER